MKPAFTQQHVEVPASVASAFASAKVFVRGREGGRERERVCVCVLVRVKERNRGRDGGRGRRLLAPRATSATEEGAHA